MDYTCQVSIAVFQELLPNSEHQLILDNLLCSLSTWHALAKLAMHTERTLKLLEAETTRLGSLLRLFRDVVCPAYDTKETPSEKDKRYRAAVRRAAKGGQANATTTNSVVPGANSSSVKPKTLNLNTYKIHALGDYVDHIRQFGCTRNFSTQLVRVSSLFIRRRINAIHLITGRSSTQKEEATI
jgi:hypothetical protein